MMVEARLDRKDQQHTCLFPTRYSFSNLRSPRCARDHKIPSLRLLAYRVGAKRQEQLGLPSGEAGSCRATDRRLMRVTSAIAVLHQIIKDTHIRFADPPSREGYPLGFPRGEAIKIQGWAGVTEPIPTLASGEPTHQHKTLTFIRWVGF